MHNVRPIKQSDYDKLGEDAKKITSLPEATAVITDEEDNPRVVFGFQQRILIEPLLSVGDAVWPEALRAAMDWLDGRLYPYRYEFFVPDSNPAFQEFCRKHLPVQEHQEIAGKFFTRIR